ncbi:MAG: hypothetical protein AVO35_00750 [Candidatus Aegiribacteria sp. MLS_C]|nr:MAG: hypothetical protein AVO35_00750 [Candidatus Aegiribacteria sp. MLS_C]
MNSGHMIEKRAILHVHTRASDGTGTVEQVIDEALSAGVDILGINDHRNLWARDHGYGGWHSSLFLLAGTELEDQGENSHMLAYGIDRLPPSKVTSEQIDFVNSEGGIAIAAHPTEAPGRLPKTRSYSWKAGREGLGGVEVWNYMSLWKKGINPLNAVRKLRHPDRCTADPDPGAVEFWQGTGGCAVACPDAHALRFGVGRRILEVFPYGMLFRRLVTHILLDDELPKEHVEAERSIIEALRLGRCFCSSMLPGDASGFRAAREGSRMMLRMPGEGDVFLDGPLGAVWRGRLEKGDHRLPGGDCPGLAVTVKREGRTWIFCGVP